MTKPSNTTLHATASPVYLAAGAVNHLIRGLPAGTAYFIGITLVTMMSGHLVHHRGSLARAALPFVAHLRWGWHGVHRAMERGHFSLDRLFDTLSTWCVDCLPVEPVCIGTKARAMHAIDTSTIARLRAGKRLGWRGKGYCHRARRAVCANIVAVCTAVVSVRGVRVGIVRRARLGASGERAVAEVCAALPPAATARLFAVDAGIATKEQFARASEQDALVGRLRANVSLRRAAPARRAFKCGRPRLHGAVLHPGARRVEGRPCETQVREVEGRRVRVRRWRGVHFARAPQVVIDVVRVDDPHFKRPLVVGTTARELTSDEIRAAYAHRWTVETNFYVAQGTCAMEMPRAWTPQATLRRISLALLTGSLLKAIAAACEPLRMGPWDGRAVGSAGRLANHLDIHAGNFAQLALRGVTPRKYRKNEEANYTNDLQLPKAA